MLDRILIHLSLIVVFAFTQIGMTAHQISHYADHQEQHQQDKNSHEEQCGQCITYSHIADATVAHDFWLSITTADPVFSADTATPHFSLKSRFYGARAPPFSLQA